jgi:hypothetical protein
VSDWGGLASFVVGVHVLEGLRFGCLQIVFGILSHGLDFRSSIQPDDE